MLLTVDESEANVVVTSRENASQVADPRLFADQDATKGGLLGVWQQTDRQKQSTGSPADGQGKGKQAGEVSVQAPVSDPELKRCWRRFLYMVGCAGATVRLSGTETGEKWRGQEARGIVYKEALCPWQSVGRDPEGFIDPSAGPSCYSPLVL